MTEEVNTVAEEAAPQLTLGDISTMVQIIDLCSKRGGFEGPELEAVGGLRSRVVKFLEANAPKDAEAPEGDVPVAEEVVEAEEA
jgi:hypothetical protein|tara:strand:- start:8380 stop:8631 length:252 start_codon:yes stop_codon:yes gene_type:complete